MDYSGRRRDPAPSFGGGRSRLVRCESRSRIRLGALSPQPDMRIERSAGRLDPFPRYRYHQARHKIRNNDWPFKDTFLLGKISAHNNANEGSRGNQGGDGTPDHAGYRTAHLCWMGPPTSASRNACASRRYSALLIARRRAFGSVRLIDIGIGSRGRRRRAAAGRGRAR